MCNATPVMPFKTRKPTRRHYFLRVNFRLFSFFTRTTRAKINPAYDTDKCAWTQRHMHYLIRDINIVKQAVTCKRACSSFSVCVQRDCSKIVRSSVSFSLSEVSSHTECWRSSSSCSVASNSSTVLSWASYKSYKYSLYSTHSGCVNV